MVISTAANPAAQEALEYGATQQDPASETKQKCCLGQSSVMPYSSFPSVVDKWTWDSSTCWNGISKAGYRKSLGLINLTKCVCLY